MYTFVCVPLLMYVPPPRRNSRQFKTIIRFFRSVSNDTCLLHKLVFSCPFIALRSGFHTKIIILSFFALDSDHVANRVVPTVIPHGNTGREQSWKVVYFLLKALKKAKVDTLFFDLIALNTLMVYDQPSLQHVYVQQGVKEEENMLEWFGLSLAWKCCYVTVSGPSSRPEWTTNDSLKLKVSACAQRWEAVSTLFQVGREHFCLFLTYCLTFSLLVNSTWTAPLSRECVIHMKRPI